MENKSITQEENKNFEYTEEELEILKLAAEISKGLEKSYEQAVEKVKIKQKEELKNNNNF